MNIALVLPGRVDVATPEAASIVRGAEGHENRRTPKSLAV
jgi:hypothetical protein